MRISSLKYRALSTIFDLFMVSIFVVIALFASKAFDIIYQIIEDLNNGIDVNLKLYDLFSILRSGVYLALVLIFYLTVVPAITKGQTLGMYIFKVRLCSVDGSDATFGQIFVRQTIVYLLLPIFTLGFSLILDLIVLVYRQDKLGLADILSKTRKFDKLDY